MSAPRDDTRTCPVFCQVDSKVGGEDRIECSYITDAYLEPMDIRFALLHDDQHVHHRESRSRTCLAEHRCVTHSLVKQASIEAEASSFITCGLRTVHIYAWKGRAPERHAMPWLV